MANIPFRNMSRKEAEQAEWSPYAKFCQALLGYHVFHIETMEKWSKSELFIHYKDLPDELQMIAERRHPSFKYIHKDEWK